MFKKLALATLLLFCTQASAERLKDPMKPWNAPSQAVIEKKARSFNLSAILYGADRRVAIVNGRTVAEGDRINGAQVVRINRHSLVLQNGDSTVRIALPGNTRLRSKS